MERILTILNQEEDNFNHAIGEGLSRLGGSVQNLAGYVATAGGKRLRPLLTLLCGRVLGCTHPDLYTLGAAIEFVHSATLMHDDIIDSATVRRGKPAAHAVFGLTETILSGDVLCALAGKMTAEMNDPRLNLVLSDAMIHTASGQVEELASMRSLSITEEEYLNIITGKTACLIRCSCQLGALRAGASPAEAAALGEFGLELGRAFQLVDDALDISPQEATGKPLGGDLREGKFTQPVRFYLEEISGQEREEFAQAFCFGEFTDDLLAKTVRRMRDLQCDSRTKELAMQYLQRAGQALLVIPSGPSRDLLEDLPAYIQNRNR